jgi:hypothetical protein
MSGEQVEFMEAAGVEQQVNAFSGEQFALFVLTFDSSRRACVSGLFFALFEIGQFFGNRI